MLHHIDYSNLSSILPTPSWLSNSNIVTNTYNREIVRGYKSSREAGDILQEIALRSNVMLSEAQNCPDKVSCRL